MGQSENTAPAADRILIRSTLSGAGDQFSLQNLNTVPLPNGALCFVLDQQALFALNKTSTKAAQTDQVVVPVSGPGRWERFATSELAGDGVSLVTSVPNNYAADGNFGIASSSNFAIDGDANDHPNWALTALGGILTYTGPTRPFMVSMFADVAVADASTPRSVVGAVSYNNDKTGSIGFGANQTTTTCNTAVVAYSLGAGRRVVLASGDTLRPKFGVAAGATGLTAELTMLVVPV